ncbi:enhanced serine sensitivity protein SseB [Mangrovactinospora gilvigrisea]|uniref:Enhanced serine sensitivity protein SseB n=1 Tax=Mangrovactinospora gilvigrisea TaxID=1428644 RepID=A0A1J7CAU1_9ACTN|nr:enhanced serine sensitivity protein SseB [Mangrovactinospora gilvigrisea]
MREGGAALPGGRTAAADRLELELREVGPGRLDAYERLLHAVADGEVRMLLWHGEPGTPSAQYGNMEVGGFGYVPAVTSAEELAASGWTRAHEVVAGRAIAGSLFRSRFGLWLNPHAAEGGVGIPWLDLRRIAGGLDRLPAGPLAMHEPTLQAPEFYERLTEAAFRAGSVRTLRQAWVRPGLGEEYLAIGVDLYEQSAAAHEAVRGMMAEAVRTAPGGFSVATVSMADEYDPVAMWMARCTEAFFQR